MAHFVSPMTVGEMRMESLEREVQCSEEQIGTAKRHGMAAWHLVGLGLYTWENNRLLILRSSKFESRQFHFSAQHKPKPGDVKGKTRGGVVKVGANYFFSDYDILSLWERKGNHYSRVSTCYPERGFATNYEVIDELNLYIGNRTMFQHGANDEYVDKNGKPKNRLKEDETFIAFDEKRNITELMSIADLKGFYRQRGLRPWIYG